MKRLATTTWWQDAPHNKTRSRAAVEASHGPYWNRRAQERKPSLRSQPCIGSALVTQAAAAVGALQHIDLEAAALGERMSCDAPRDRKAESRDPSLMKRASPRSPSLT